LTSASNDRPRILLVGASNVSRSQRLLLRESLAIAGAPAEVFLVAGRGRSYGAPSTLAAVRTLPGILQCGVWPLLAQREEPPLYALVTDIGNDLAYGFAADEVAGWVEECLDRLLRLAARVVVTALPVDRLAALRPAHFRAVRTLLFPMRGLTYERMIEETARLDALVRALAAARGVPCVTPRREWYGYDPIHLRWSARRAAWAEILALWRPTGSAAPTAARLPVWRSFTLRPAEYRLFGRRRAARQPVARLADGTTVSAY
jgi:hypothetical protein